MMNQSDVRTNVSSLRRSRLITGVLPCGVLAAVLLTLVSEQTSAETEKKTVMGVTMIVQASNPNPALLPTLGVWEDTKLSPGKRLTMVSASFPDVPGFICDSWCYETGGLQFVGAKPVEGGRLELCHSFGAPNAELVTTVTPEPGAVEFLARVRLKDRASGAMPINPPALNLCWQVRRALTFCSAFGTYPDFIERCFIFTPKGRTFLLDAKRQTSPRWAADDPYNNPPWVQVYVRLDQPIPSLEKQAKSFAGCSPDRYTIPVIGVVSRDRKHLAAIANDSATTMCQAWHDCLHNNAQWLPANKLTGERVWRLMVYAMSNDPSALLGRLARDFPALAGQMAAGQ